MNRTLQAIQIANKEYETDFPLHLHAMNVATMATCVATRMNLNEELTFCAGLLHDVGKMYCGMSIIPDHPMLTRSRLLELNVDEEIANVAGVHHWFQTYPYPDFSQEVLRYTEYPEAELISLCDKVEAGMTRSHETPEQALRKAIKIYPMYDTNMIDVLRDTLYSVKTM